MTNKQDNKIINFRRKINTEPIPKNIENNTEEIETDEFDELVLDKLLSDYKEEQMKDVLQNHILEEVNHLKTELKISNAEIANTNKIISICGTVVGFLIAGLGLLISVLIFGINAKYDAIQDISKANMNEIKSEIQSINQRLDYQERLNSLQIESDINKKIIELKRTNN